MRRGLGMVLLVGLGLGLAGCGDPTGDIPGVYVLDRETFRREALERLRRGASAEAEGLAGPARRALETTWQQQAEAEAAAIRLRLDLGADGRFAVVYRYGDEQGHGRGSWALQGDRLLLRTEEESGRPLPKPLEAEAALDDSGMRLSGDRVPIPIPLVRAVGVEPGS